MKQKEREEKKSKKIVKMVIGLKKIVSILQEKHAKFNFVSVLIIDVVKEVGNYFHNNFKAGFRAH